MRGSLGEKDRRRRLGGHPRLGARSGREAVQVRRRAAAQSARGANDPQFAAGLPAPEVFDEVGGSCSTEPITGSSSRATGSIGRICKLAPVDREATTSDASG